MSKLFFFPEKLDLKRNAPYDGVESFVLFVGYPRNGHSLIAAILDSHPEIIIPDEVHILANFKSFYKDPNEGSCSRRLRIFSALHSRSYSQSIQGKRSPNNRHGYSYYIPGSWQGQYRNQIKVSKVTEPLIILTIFQLKLIEFNSLNSFSSFNVRRLDQTIKMAQN